MQRNRDNIYTEAIYQDMLASASGPSISGILLVQRKYLGDRATEQPANQIRSLDVLYSKINL